MKFVIIRREKKAYDANQYLFLEIVLKHRKVYHCVKPMIKIKKAQLRNIYILGFN